MGYVYIGKLVNTHGIKGEVRILSNFKYKNLVFKEGFKFYLGQDKEEVTVVSYRPHKIYDMVIFEGYYDINQVLAFKGFNVYVKRSELKVDYLNEELVGFDVYDKRLKKVIGKLTMVREDNKQELLVIENHIYIPKVEQFVKKIDLNDKQIVVETIGGMLDEN